MATNLQFIKEESAYDVSSFTITDIFSDSYDVYQVFVRGNGRATVGSLSAEFLDSSGSDIAQGAYDYAILRLLPAGSFGDVYGVNANSFEYTYPGSSDYDFSALLTVYNPYSSSTYTFCSTQSMSLQGNKGVIAATSTTSATGMKFYANQNYTPIVVSVYGVK